MLVVIDNYDSFTYNIVQTIAASLQRQGREMAIQVYRNDAISIAELEALAPERLLISPGPCDPERAGISVAAIKHFAGKIPILGVCLGHQSMAAAFAGKVVRADRLMHGKTSPMNHDNRGIFRGLANPFAGMRYHSLIVEEKSLPACFTISCRSDQGELMGMRHRDYPMEGVQFHPESIMSPEGVALLENFIAPNYLENYPFAQCEEQP